MDKLAMQQTSSITSPKTRDDRLDFIKAICIILVLFWHLQPIDVSAPRLQTYHFDLLLKEAIKFFYLQVTLLGVPAFILVSLYLYFNKLAEHGYQYASTRLLHLLKLFVFWVSCQIIIVYLVTIPKSIPFSDQFALLAKAIPLRTLLLEGGPPLPFSGGLSVFYFFSTLILLTILATVFSVMARNTLLGVTTGALITIGSLVYFESSSLRGVNVSLLDIRTFMVYIPIAYYFQPGKLGFSKGLLWFTLAGYILFSVQDYFLRTQGPFVNVYLRPTIVFGATALFYGIKNLQSWKNSKALSFLSIYSLGIFAIHKYFQYLSIVMLTPLFEAYGIVKKIPLGEFRVNVQTILIAILTVSLTFLCVVILDKTPLRKFIR